MGSVTVEERGRVVLPAEIREKFHIRPGEKLRVESKGDEIVLIPESSAEEVKSLKGCVKDSSIDPLELKEIWKM
ncbi:MAG: AbrB/MazE/SpoVT family DNA-binding domain-containing protein [Candidatus Nanohaloarchaea archaeon]|nr:AbrB/MazE/SpoVT family DNA-binding domain-containing protein [Candidatus Nanohaloarchaea archaeon]